MSDDLERGYWPRLIWHSARYYARRGKFLAMLRTLWIQVVRHDNEETCQECGKGYLLWMANGALYERVKGNRGGLLCPRCFDRLARVKGIHVCWVPHPVFDEDGDHWTELDREIGAFCG